MKENEGTVKYIICKYKKEIINGKREFNVLSKFDKLPSLLERTKI